MADDAREGGGIFDLSVLAALKQAGCVLCHVARADARLFLRDLFHEYVNDVDLTRRLMDAWGFCPAHACEAMEVERALFGAPLGFAIVGERVIRRIMEDIRALVANGGGAGVGRPTPCPACRRGQASVDFALRRLAGLMHRPEFRSWRDSSGGLCANHLRTCALLARTDGSARRLLDEELDRLEELGQELGEYIRKTDHRYAKEAKGPEGDAPARFAVFLGSHK